MSKFVQHLCAHVRLCMCMCVFICTDGEGSVVCGLRGSQIRGLWAAAAEIHKINKTTLSMG